MNCMFTSIPNTTRRDEGDSPREEPFKQVPQEGNAKCDSQYAQLLACLLLPLLGVQGLDQGAS